MSDGDLKELFGVLRQQDETQYQVPEFETVVPKKKTIFRPWMYAAAAVAAVLLGWFTLFQNPAETEAIEDFDLSLEIIESEETDPLLADNQDMYDWEAATDILIKDFDE